MTDLMEKRERLNQAALPSRRFWRMIAAGILALLVLASIPAGIWIWRGHAERYRQQAREYLLAVAHLKAGQIAAWRQERLQDGLMIQRNPWLASAAGRLLATAGTNNESRQQLDQWMANARASAEYSRLVLYDAEGRVRQAWPENENWEEPALAPLIPEAMRSGQVVMTDLHHNASPDRINLDLLVPLKTESAGTGAPGPAGGLLVLEINPQQTLYLLVQNWPNSSTNAEIQLVRQDENVVLFLNDLRQRPNSALVWRLPMNDMELPAARAIRGETGVVTGVVTGMDNRKTQVLAALSKIPESPWYLVAQANQQELFGPIQRAGGWLLGLAGALLFVTFAGLWLMRQELLTQGLRRELVAEQERQVLNERIGCLMRQANDIILLTDQQWNILEANDQAVAAYGHPLPRLRQMSLRELLPAKARTEFERQLAKMRPETGMVMELTHQRQDGSTFPVAANFRLIAFGGVRYCQAVIRNLASPTA